MDNILILPNAVISDKKEKRLKDFNHYEFFPTSFQFLAGNRGLRPEKLHLILGTTGSGKSSLARAMLVDTASKSKVLSLLSEESHDDFCLGLSYSNLSNEIKSNIFVRSELELDNNIIYSIENYRHHIELLINHHSPHAVFYDNLTTSMIYMGMSPQEQSQHIHWWKNLALKKGFALVVIAHTRAGIADNMSKLIEDSDIRGSKTPSNIAEYLYIFQRLRISDRFYPFIRVVKSRSHQNNGIYFLKFDATKRAYVSDKKVDYQEFIKNFKLRDQV